MYEKIIMCISIAVLVFCIAGCSEVRRKGDCNMTTETLLEHMKNQIDKQVERKENEE